MLQYQNKTNMEKMVNVFTKAMNKEWCFLGIKRLQNLSL